MKQSQVAEYFGVSLTTVQNWKRQGAPTSADLPGIVEWRTRRELELAGISDLLPGLPGFEAELVRRREHLDKAITWVNAMKPGTDAEPNLLKIALCLGLSLEGALLDLPRRIIGEAKAETLPEDVYRIIFSAIDQAKGNDEQEGGPK